MWNRFQCYADQLSDVPDNEEQLMARSDGLKYF